MTNDEIRSAVLAALLDYETLKKERRFKAVKTTLRSTVMATVMGSTGLMAAHQDKPSMLHKFKSAVAMNVSAVKPEHSLPSAGSQQIVFGAAHFGLGRYDLSESHKARLLALVQQLPPNAEIVVVGQTDAVGGHSYNKKLAKMRALSVANFLGKEGIKVKEILGKVSQQQNSWLQRRVDVVIEHAAHPMVAIALPPILDLYDSRGEVAQSAPELPVIAPAKKRSASASQGAANQAVDRDNYNLMIVPDSGYKQSVNKPSTQRKNPQSAHASVKQQSVRGAAHFALNRTEITAAHKERLDNLIKQLPENAELIVIGRTDVAGEKHVNEKLGQLRAQAVARYLAGSGVKIAGVGIKAASHKAHGWSARRVDILVSYEAGDLRKIKLPPLHESHLAPNSKPNRIKVKLTSIRQQRSHHMMDQLEKAMKKMDSDNKALAFINPSETWQNAPEKAGDARLRR